MHSHIHNQEKELSSQVRSSLLVKENNDDSRIILGKNVIGLSAVLQWLEYVAQCRMKELEAGKENSSMSDFMQALNQTELKETSLEKLLTEFGQTYVELILIAVSFAAYFKPESLINYLLRYDEAGKRKLDPGGIFNKHTERFTPTLQTALFLLAGSDPEKQGYYYGLLTNHPFFKNQVLHLRSLNQLDRFPLDQVLEMDLAYYDYLISGKKPRMDAGHDFPATLLETNKSFSDLILKESVLEQIQLIRNFAQSQYTLFNKQGVKEKIKPGFLAMLYGPPGTGKTLTVSVLSKELGIDAYRVDLSRVISKYIGETEKNLERIFARLEDKRCILFFDEADVIFGKRTEVADAKDRYANQEVAYLLQRIEGFPGLVILASNFKQNLDDAFRRRILVSIYMPPPNVEERFQMWSKGLPESFHFEKENMAMQLAEQHTFTGANIANIIKLSCLQAESEGTTVITYSMMEPFIKMEYAKEGMQNKPIRNLRDVD